MMAIRPRSVGELLDGAIRLYKQDMGLYMFTAIAASLPMALVMILALTGGASTSAAILTIALAPIAIVAAISVWTALMIQMNDRLEGREPELRTSVRRSLSLVLRVVWGAILAYVVLAGMMLVSVFGIALVGGALSMVAPPLVTAIAIGIASVAAFVFVALPVIAGLFLFLPGIVVEQLTGYQSVKRGFALAKGGQFRILAVLFLSWILIVVPVSAVYVITGTSSMILDPTAVSTGVVSTTQLVVQQVLAIIASGFTTPFMVAAILLVYFDQRVRREAYDLQAEADALAG
jgi:hypothetical protein